jgi:hypothetical protein
LSPENKGEDARGQVEVACDECVGATNPETATLIINTKKQYCVGDAISETEIGYERGGNEFSLEVNRRRAKRAAERVNMVDRCTKTIGRLPLSVSLSPLFPPKQCVEFNVPPLFPPKKCVELTIDIY